MNGLNARTSTFFVKTLEWSGLAATVKDARFLCQICLTVVCSVHSPRFDNVTAKAINLRKQNAPSVHVPVPCTASHPASTSTLVGDDILSGTAIAISRRKIQRAAAKMEFVRKLFQTTHREISEIIGKECLIALSDFPKQMWLQSSWHTSARKLVSIDIKESSAESR